MVKSFVIIKQLQNMTIKEYNFKKGFSGNPNGRPKGSFSPLRKQLLELRKLAINDASEIYQELREKNEIWRGLGLSNLF